MNDVRAFEDAFAEYVGAKHAVAMCNGTSTLHAALLALGVKPGDRVAVPPLTMASTTIAVLQAGAVPVFCDVHPASWLMGPQAESVSVVLPVSLYGLHMPALLVPSVDDAAQTLRPHGFAVEFTSYSFQASKILPLGEGGMLVTNDDDLAHLARSFSSLGYLVEPGGEIPAERLKHPGYSRHYRLAPNYRMAAEVAALGTLKLAGAGHLKELRHVCAHEYGAVIDGVDWIRPQHVPDGWQHDYWTYAVALEDPDLWETLAVTIENYGGERPYAAWRLTYQEPAFRHLAEDGTCPVAEDLQPRLMQFQTNSVAAAEKNARALARAIRDIGG